MATGAARGPGGPEMAKTPMICEVCQEPLAPGDEAVLPQEEMKLHVEPGKARVGLLRHKDPATCKEPKKAG